MSLAVAVSTVGIGMPGQAQSTTGAGISSGPGLEHRLGFGPASSPDESPVVTLVTGDQVHLGHVPGGRATVHVEPAPRPDGSTPSFGVSGRGDDLYVVPSDMRALIPERLDAALFNVTYLAEHGYADHTGDATLPLIFTYPEDQVRTLESESFPGTEDLRSFTSVPATALTADVSESGDFAAAVFELAESASADDGSVHTFGSTAGGPLANVQKIWLDAVVTAQLGDSTDQISAPPAWEAGFDGSGVTVAVLDSGIDAEHPDLDGQVAASRNFTWDEDAADLLGHGTHVASIVAGTGAASDGLRRGVAPGATLLDGKVLDASGSGFLSWIIDGMEWAAEQGADIVNLSLGLHPGHVQAPVLTEALESLSSTHDTLFVAAAGNGYCGACIGSPGDAHAALTVGAVDRDDQLADFSSRGPVFRTFGLKPDLPPPGGQTEAARAAGTGHGEGPYVAYSGTSMAAPHVAGAAALAKQARPELDAQELKGLLMSTATPTDGVSAYDQGAGRVTIDHAVSSALFAVSGSVDFGLQTFPEGDVEPLRQAITYRNASAEPVTLDLDVDAGVELSVEPSQITVPPGATASAEVVLDLTAAELGAVTGHVVATSGDGTRLRNPVGYYLEERHFELTLSGIARDGRPARLWGNVIDSIVVDVETGEPMYDLCPEQPPGHDLCIRVPAGTYSVMAFIFTKPQWAESDGNPYTTTPLHTSLVGNPEMTIDADTVLTLDARDAVEVHVETPAHDAAPILGGAFELAWYRTPADGPTTFDFQMNVPGNQLEERFFMQPTGEVSTGEFTATSRWRLAEPEVTLEVSGSDHLSLSPRYFRPDYFSDNSWQFPMVDDAHELPLVDAGQGRTDDIAGVDLDGALALIERSDHVSVAEQSNLAAEAGAEMVAIYNDQPGLSAEIGTLGIMLDVPTVRISREEGLSLLDELASGPVTVRADGTVVSPYTYDLVYAERGGISPNLTYEADPASSAVTVERDLHTQLERMTFSETSYPFQPGAAFATGFTRPMLGVPDTRTDYHNADPSVEWQYAVHTPEARRNYIEPRPPEADLVFLAPLTSYDNTGRHRQSWFRQPLAPGFHPTRPVTRYGDILLIPTAGLIDAGGNFAQARTSFGMAGIEALFQVWRGDELIGETTGLPSGTIQLPPDEDTYRITYDIANVAPWSKMSTRTSTAWSFRSAHADEAGEVVPLMNLGYEFILGLDNRLVEPRERRGPNTVEVSIGHQEGVDIPVKDVSFEVSYDDGATWQTVRTHRQGEGAYLVNLGNRSPANGTGFVSVRVSAEDARGNRIEQEVIRAAALAAR
jgi:subtilisin family serine protease